VNLETPMEGYRHWSLRTRLVLLVLLAFVPAVILSIYNGVEQRHRGRGEVLTDTLRLARLAAADQRRLVEGARQTLLLIARLPEVRGGDSRACSAALANLRAQFPAYLNLGVTDASGWIVCSALPIAEPVDARDRAWYQRAVQARDFVMGTYQVGRVTGRPTINLAAPVADASGATRGVVFAALDLAAIARVAAEARLPDGAALMVVDSTGTVLGRYPNPARWVGQSLSNLPLVRAIIGDEREGTVEAHDLDGITRLHAFSRVDRPAAAGAVYVSIGVPVGLAFAAADRALAEQLAGLALAAVIALTAAVVVGHAFVGRRLGTLAAAATRLAAGDLSARSGLAYTREEVGELARAFDEMAGALHARIVERDRANAALARAGQALRDSEERVRELLESASDAIYSLDLEGRITSINAAGERLLGVPPGGAVGIPLRDLVAPGQGSDAVAVLERQPADAAQTIHEIEGVRPDGTPFTLEVTSRLARRDGRPVGIHGFARDITARRRAEQQIRFQARLLDAVGQAVTASDREGRFTYWNRQAERLFGWTAEEVLGRVALDLAPAPHARRLAEEVRSRVLAGETCSGEVPLRHRDGRAFVGLVTTSPVFDEAGQVVGLIGVTGDISDLKRAEAEIRGLNLDLEQRVLDRTRALAEREQQLAEAAGFLERLIAASPGVIFKADLRTQQVTYVSANIEWMTGRPPSYFLGPLERLWSMVHPDDREATQARIGRATTAHEPAVELEYRFAHADGGLRWFYLIARIEYDAAGIPVGLVGHALDMTPRKEAEEALRLAKQEADDANQAKNEFLSRMSHELRTPLNAVLGFGQLLELDDLREEQRVSVAHIIRAGRHLLELINEVLDISGIEAGRFAVSPEPVSVRDVAQEALALIQPLAAEMRVRIESLMPAGEDGRVLADRKRLGQVLLNLISNAVKYNHRGGSVSVSAVAVPGGRTRIQVSDTGPGIHPAMVHRLFRPFERLGAGPTAIEGTGLGLALSKRLMNAMGGTIGVDSRLGEGSTFWVELPAVEAPPRRHERETDGRLPGAGHASLTVLYVEDNLPNLELIQRVLVHRPWVRLISAMQGQMGLDLAREHRPGLLLLDLHLPDIPGDEVFRRLRADPRTQTIPVVIVSADAPPGQIDRLLNAGVTAYLTKPIDVRRLVDLIDGASPAEVRRHAWRGRP
jgi:PAS domain S-box-containing protein